jgi:hypothetical protein
VRCLACRVTGAHSVLQAFKSAHVSSQKYWPRGLIRPWHLRWGFRKASPRKSCTLVMMRLISPREKPSSHPVAVKTSKAEVAFLPSRALPFLEDTDQPPCLGSRLSATVRVMAALTMNHPSGSLLQGVLHKARGATGKGCAVQSARNQGVRCKKREESQPRGVL